MKLLQIVMPARPETLTYFKDLIEGRDVPSWHPFWKANKDSLLEELGRNDFLRLKFGRLQAAAKILAKHGIAVAWSAKGRREAAWANLDESVVDERGRPSAEFRKAIYGGAVAAFSAGEVERGTELLAKYVRKLRRISNDLRRAEELEEMEFDAASFCDEGETAAGLAMLRAVATWTTDRDLELAAVENAREKLRSIGASE